MRASSANSVARINIPASLQIGGGAISLVGMEADRLGLKRVLIVSDPYMTKSGLPELVGGILNESGISSTVFGEVQPDPTIQNVVNGLDALRDFGSDGLVAVGGGSSIDAAKAISILAMNDGPLSEYMGYDRIPFAGLPLIAVPTTAGTGSECTKVTVITDSSTNIKMMLLDPHLLPSAAIVDYQLTMTMPQALTAHVGVDTLTHGMEAYVSAKANSMTDVLALSCIGLVGRNLLTAWADPENLSAREGMMLAASQGGMAFSNSSVCLVHGMSRPLGAAFHIAHGLSNAMLLPSVTEFSILGAPDRYAKVAATLGWSIPTDSVETSCVKLVEGLSKLNADLKVPKLSDCDISRLDLENQLGKMAKDALASGSPQNNPTVPDEMAISDLYRRAF